MSSSVGVTDALRIDTARARHVSRFRGCLYLGEVKRGDYHIDLHCFIFLYLICFYVHRVYTRVHGIDDDYHTELDAL